MLLRNARSKGLRSIENAEIGSCGRFNVLIGKNNSGKSNLLSAILGFFDTIKSGEIINQEPKFSTEDDFYDKITKSPIEISCTFEITGDDTSRILQSMTDEFPQISNAVSAVQGSRYLRATAKYYIYPKPFGMLSKVEFSRSHEATTPESYVTIYEVIDDVAPQILEKFQAISEKKQEVEVYQSLLRQFDSDDYARVSRPDRGPYQLRFFVERYSPSGLKNPAALSTLEGYLKTSTSFSEFQEILSAGMLEIQSLILEIEKAPIAGAILTFGGQQHQIPAYMIQICEWLSEVEVLYQSERREPIGQADAQRLLSLRVRKGGDRLFQLLKASVTALIGVEVDAFEDSTPMTTVERMRGGRRAQLDVDNFIVQANGSGVREALTGC